MLLHSDVLTVVTLESGNNNLTIFGSKKKKKEKVI